MNPVKESLKSSAQPICEDAWNVARAIGQKPELGYKEYFAVESLTEFLNNHGFQVEKGIGGIETAFKAVYRGSLTGPKVAFLAEYDALPDIGHGCGHNLIGSASAGAAVLLSKAKELSGEILVIGTPAEETSGAKVTLVEKGVFEGLDAALMFHPGSQNVSQITTLALDALEFTFMGKGAHAAAAPHYGINALDALINFFIGINALKKQVGDDVRINGIITEGGTTPNIIPEKAVARFYLRARKRRVLDELREQVIRCAEGAAAMVSAKVSWKKFEFSYDELKCNTVLANCFERNVKELGINQLASPQIAMGSVDMGNVSRVVPSIHPYLTLGTGTEIPHTKDFAHAVMSPDGKKLLDIAIKALAFTAWDVLHDPNLLSKIKKDFYFRQIGE